jgi:hypothetical protein
MVVPEDEVESSGEDPVLLGEPGVPEATGAAFPVLAPEQGQGDALAPELAVDVCPVGNRAGDGGRWWCRPPVQALLEIAVVELGWQGPGKTGLGRLDDVPADGGAGQACRDACEGRAQALGEAEPEGFSDLAHGSTGTKAPRNLPSWNPYGPEVLDHGRRDGAARSSGRYGTSSTTTSCRPMSPSRMRWAFWL